MDRILPSTLEALDETIDAREQALRVFLLTLESSPPDLGDADYDLDAARHRVMQKHPDLVGDLLRSMAPLAVSWLFAQNYFLTIERMPGDLEMLYVLLRDSIVVPDVHEAAVSVFTQIDTHMDSPSYLKCKYLIVPMFPDDYDDERIRAFLADAWQNDDLWLAISVLQNYYGMGQHETVNMGHLEDLLDLANDMIGQAPKTTIYFARLVELETTRDDLSEAARQSIAQLNASAEALNQGLRAQEDAPLRTQGAADPHFHARKCRLFSEAPDEFDDEWRAHLDAILSNPPPVPSDALAAIRVLRREFHVCHECTDLLPDDYLHAVWALCENSEGGRAYMRLVLKPKRKVRPIEQIVREYLKTWKQGDDHSTPTDVRIYLSVLSSRENRQE